MRVLCRACHVEVNEGETCVNGHLYIPEPNRFKIVMTFGHAGDPAPQAPPIRVKLFDFYKTTVPTDGPSPPGSRWDTPSTMPVTIPRHRTYILRVPTTERRNGHLIEVDRHYQGGYNLADCNACELDEGGRVGGQTTKGSLLHFATFEEACTEAEARVNTWEAKGATLLRYEDRE